MHTKTNLRSVNPLKEKCTLMCTQLLTKMTRNPTNTKNLFSHTRAETNFKQFDEATAHLLISQKKLTHKANPASSSDQISIINIVQTGLKKRYHGYRHSLSRKSGRCVHGARERNNGVKEEPLDEKDRLLLNTATTTITTGDTTFCYTIQKKNALFWKCITF